MKSEIYFSPWKGGFGERYCFLSTFVLKYYQLSPIHLPCLKKLTFEKKNEEEFSVRLGKCKI